MNHSKTIIYISGAVFLAGAIYLLTRKKDAIKQPGKQSGPGAEPEATAPPIVTIDKPSVNVYSINATGGIGKVTRYTKTANEKAGKFIGYKAINKSVYVMFSDSYNNGTESLVLKILTNYKNR